MDLSKQNLSKLPGDLSVIYNNSFDCSENILTTLVGSPRVINLSFSCIDNKLSNLLGGPEKVGSFINCISNELTSLEGVPKFIGSNIWLHENKDLRDVSDIWESEILGEVFFCLTPNLAILPLIKFNLGFLYHDLHVIRRHRGSSKQNILDFQHDLMENGYGDYAKWKPDAI